MYFLIYKIVNNINGNFYIGKHQTDNLTDNYFGSGINLKKAIKKYGKENFSREILFIFDSELEMNSKEVELVNESLLKRNDCYNIALGGEGGPHFRNKRHSIETKQKISDKNLGKIVSNETRLKISDVHKNKIVSSETKSKLSISMKAKYKNGLEESTKKKISYALIGRKRNKFWITDGKNNLYISYEEEIPENYFKGRTL